MKLAIIGSRNLTQISIDEYIPEGVTEISEGAFFGCSNLKEIELPKSVTKIESDAFCGCSKLKSIKIPKDCKLEDGWNCNCKAKVIYY